MGSRPTYRLRAVMSFLAKKRGFVTINEVAKKVDMSWNTAKDDLDYLADEEYVIRKVRKRGGKKISKYRLNRKREY